MTNIGQEIAVLVADTLAAHQELSQLQFDAPADDVLAAPASPIQLGKLSGKLGMDLPPSYRAFLELHNGWRIFEGDLAILGSDDHDVDWVKERVKEWAGLFGSLNGEDIFASWGFPIMLGETSSRVLVFDRRTRRQDGELEVVAYDNTNEDGRYPTFADVLRKDLEVTREAIEQEKDGLPSD